MTFKSTVTLSIIAVFVLGSFALAETPFQSAPETTPSVSSGVDGNSASATSDKTPSTSTPSTQPESVSSEESSVIEVFPVPESTSFNRTRGYTVQQIRRMPMVARPDRPGHFFGNTVRAIYRARHGR